MKEFAGNLWTEVQEKGTVRIGFSRRFIEERLGECFHVMQADIKSVKKGDPLFVIETNDGLESLKSPLSGNILVFSAKARNFPDRLTEDDVIAEVLPEGTKIKAEKKVATTKKEADRVWGDMQGFFNNVVPPPALPANLTRAEVERILQEQRARRG